MRAAPSAAAASSVSLRQLDAGRPASLCWLRGSDRDFVAPRVPKSDGIRDLLHRSIRRNVIYRACAEEELRDLVAASAEARFAVGAVVIRQEDGVTSFVS